ncbi:bifunctional 2-polyprenyl-6-hydroxyphenol methylase/3-demethylubiquinol 3-O-methyltransferase UbiG [Elongatibacter sediminis]|uniref:Ubiquinone biosynthesis O-methyltransferase n=1 Tax=Elongatibacter sediminis TaxID=3119006 RepID=A0AAW9RDS0_9GAMM
MMVDQRPTNLDESERLRFDNEAAAWWDPAGPFRPLHDLNPARLRYVAERVALDGRTVLDVGCGGGILAEALARQGAKVTGLDIAPSVLAVARLHLLESGLDVDYRQSTIEEFAEQSPASFDVITCMEMLEHVPDPRSVIRAIATRVKPGGHVFVSTLNRTIPAFLLGIVGAEYVARLLPRGTHRYDRFIRPSELAATARQAGLRVRDITGLHYEPVSRTVRTGGHVRINYLAHLQRPHDQ